MTSEKKVEVRVSTWLAVIAEMARQAERVDTTEVMRCMLESMDDIENGLAVSQSHSFHRVLLIRGAAAIMRALDERFPGDGLEFE